MDQVIADHIALSNFPRGCIMDNKFFIILERIPRDSVKNKNALFLLCYHLANLIWATMARRFHRCVFAISASYRYDIKISR